MRRTSLPALLVVLVMALSACGSDDDKAPKLDAVGGSSDTPSASPSTEPTKGSATKAPPSEDAGTFDDEGNEAIRGDVDATTPEEQAVVDAWFAYWTVRTRSFFAAKVDPDLGKVAVSDAVSDVVSYVAYLQKKKLHTVGDTRFGVSDIDIDSAGTSATLTSCAENRSIDRTADGAPAEDPIAFFTATGTLVKAGGSWRVVTAPTQSSSDCRS